MFLKVFVISPNHAKSTTLDWGLVIKPLAVRDIDRQAAYLSTVRGQLGERFVRSVRAATEKIARQPTIGSQLPQGEDGLGFNMFYGHYGQDTDAHFIRAGVDFMANCVMSGGHQMDLRMECDWSDPLVTRGGTRRVVRRAMMDRTRPNVPGVHFYDEPGLTWHKHPATGEFTPHGIPSQLRFSVPKCGLRTIAHSAGVRLSETINEISVALAMVSANCL